MIKALLFLLENVPYSNDKIKIARGYYKYPENWHEFKKYIRLRLR